MYWSLFVRIIGERHWKRKASSRRDCACSKNNEKYRLSCEIECLYDCLVHSGHLFGHTAIRYVCEERIMVAGIVTKKSHVALTSLFSQLEHLGHRFSQPNALLLISSPHKLRQPFQPRSGVWCFSTPMPMSARLPERALDWCISSSWVHDAFNQNKTVFVFVRCEMYNVLIGRHPHFSFCQIVIVVSL